MDAFTTPVTNSTNKYGEAFVMPKQTVQIIIPTVVLIVGQNIVAQRDMKGIVFPFVLCCFLVGKRIPLQGHTDHIVLCCFFLTQNDGLY